MPTAPFDESRAHRWFAVEFNNLAWDLLEKPDRTAEDNERLRHAAHAACLHWQATGSVLNDLRAHVLLTTTYAHLGPGASAQHYAQLTSRLSEQAGAEQTSFDRATVLGSAALAMHTAAQIEQAQLLHQQALQAAQSLTETGDREVFERFYGTLPVRNAST
jgi:hypothetical protein